MASLQVYEKVSLKSNSSGELVNKTFGGEKMKKIFAMIVLALFILSVVPMAFADHPGENTDEEDRREKNIREETMEKSIEEKRPKTKNAKAVKALERVRERLAKSKVSSEKARERLIVAKEKYSDARERFNEHKGKLVEMKKAARVCEDDSETCKKGKLNLKIGVKNHLLKTVNLISSSLERLSERVEDSKLLTAEQKEDALLKIDALEERLIAERESVEALADEATAEELRDAVKSLKELWKEVRKEQKKIIAGLTHSKLGSAVEKHNGLVQSMEARIASLEKIGADVSELKDILTRFREHVTAVQDDYAAAKEKWQSADNRLEALGEWREAQKAVRERMKESKVLLREFVAAYSKLKENVDKVDSGETEE